MSRAILAVLAGGLFLSSCFWSGEERYKTVDMHGAVSEVKIPSDMWDLIESMYTGEEAVKKVQGGDEEGNFGIYSIIRKRSKVQTPIKFFRMKLHLVESNYGVLGKKDYQLDYGLGGGDLDFARFVKAQEGSFKIKFTLGVDHGDAEDFKVFYWGNGRRRKMGGEVFGSGCDKFFDITQFFQKKVLVRGIAATTHRRKYVTTLSGTYVFVVKKGGSLYISQITMQDSRYSVLQCRS